MAACVKATVLRFDSQISRAFSPSYSNHHIRLVFNEDVRFFLTKKIWRDLVLQEKKEEKVRAAAKNKAKEVEKKKLIDAQASNQANFYAC